MSFRCKIMRVLPYILVVFIFILVIKYWNTVISNFFKILSVSTPLIIGCVIAYILNILLSFYEEKFLNKITFLSKYKRILSLVMSVVTCVFILVMILLMIIPQMKYAITTLINKIPVFFDEFTKWLQTFEGNQISVFIENILSDYSIDKSNIIKNVENIIKWAGGGAGNTIGILNSAIGATINFFMGFVFAFYILMEKEKLSRQIEKVKRKFLKAEFISKLDHVLGVVNNCFRSFIVGQCIEAVILGILCTLGMFIFRFPYALMTGIVVGATAIIPIFGAYIGMAVGFVMIFTDSPLKALLFLVYLNVLQQIENQLIYPRVVGDSIGLPGIWIFAAVIIGSGVFGVMGMLVFIPLVAAGYQLFREKVNG